MRNLTVGTCLVFVLAGGIVACAQSPQASPLPPAEQTDVLATVDGKLILLKDLGIQGKLLQLRQQQYELERDALDDAIAEALIESEASRRNVSTEELLETEVDRKVADPTDEEVEALYNQQRQRIRTPLDEVRPQLVDALKNFRARQLRDELVSTLREKSNIEVRLDPPRLQVDLEEAPLRGPSDAPVTIVEFSDFQCPFCKRAQAVIDQLRERYPTQVNWRFKDLPLVSIHPEAQYAAEAARCAAEQDKFWEYRDALFSAEKITREIHDEVSESLGLDTESFGQCLASQRQRAAVQADSDEAASLGLTGTPSFLVNGILLAGAQPLEEFVRVIDRELSSKGGGPQPSPGNSETR